MPFGAIAGGALIGGVGSYFGGKAQADAIGKGIGVEQQAEQRLLPFTNTGQSAMYALADLFGLDRGGGGPTGAGIDVSQFEKYPGYQFTLQQADRNLELSNAAKGLLKSGANLRGLQDTAAGLASQTFGQYVSQLLGISGQGEQAAGAGVQGAANIANSYAQQGAANASQIVGPTNAITNALTQYAGLSALTGNSPFGNVWGTSYGLTYPSAATQGAPGTWMPAPQAPYNPWGTPAAEGGHFDPDETVLVGDLPVRMASLHPPDYYGSHEAAVDDERDWYAREQRVRALQRQQQLDNQAADDLDTYYTRPATFEERWPRPKQQFRQMPMPGQPLSDRDVEELLQGLPRRGRGGRVPAYATGGVLAPGPAIVGDTPGIQPNQQWAASLVNVGNGTPGINVFGGIPTSAQPFIDPNNQLSLPTGGGQGSSLYNFNVTGQGNPNPPSLPNFNNTNFGGWTPTPLGPLAPGYGPGSTSGTPTPLGPLAPGYAPSNSGSTSDMTSSLVKDFGGPGLPDLNSVIPLLSGGSSTVATPQMQAFFANLFGGSNPNLLSLFGGGNSDLLSLLGGGSSFGTNTNSSYQGGREAGGRVRRGTATVGEIPLPRPRPDDAPRPEIFLPDNPSSPAEVVGRDGPEVKQFQEPGTVLPHEVFDPRVQDAQRSSVDALSEHLPSWAGDFLKEREKKMLAPVSGREIAGDVLSTLMSAMPAGGRGAMVSPEAAPPMRGIWRANNLVDAILNNQGEVAGKSISAARKLMNETLENTPKWARQDPAQMLNDNPRFMRQVISRLNSDERALFDELERGAPPIREETMTQEERHQPEQQPAPSVARTPGSVEPEGDWLSKRETPELDLPVSEDMPNFLRSEPREAPVDMFELGQRIHDQPYRVTLPDGRRVEQIPGTNRWRDVSGRPGQATPFTKRPQEALPFEDPNADTGRLAEYMRRIRGYEMGGRPVPGAPSMVGESGPMTPGLGLIAGRTVGPSELPTMNATLGAPPDPTNQLAQLASPPTAPQIDPRMFMPQRRPQSQPERTFNTLMDYSQRLAALSQIGR